ncbi:MAG: efflux RND transporter periplasmic adaptor subunit [Minicystis sp.]
MLSPRQRRFILYPATFLAAGMIACSSGGSGGAPRTRPPPLVAVAKVEARDVPVEVQAPVDLRPLEQADVGSKILGYLDAVLVDRGDKVKKGQLLALVRPSDLPDQLAAARGALAQAEAARRLAGISADRAQQLRPEGLAAQSDVDRAVSTLASAEASEAAAKAQIAALATKLGETRIESPLTGVVMNRKLDPGALVGTVAGAVILTVARTDVLRVFVTVNERDAAGVNVGMDAHVEVDALPGKSFGGKVVRLAPGFDAVTRTLDAEVDLDNATGELRPGMYGRGAIRLAVHPHATVIPIAALQISDKARYVYVIAGDKAQRRPVETGVDGGDWLEITRGLAPGDEVVVAGADGLSDGAAVRVAREKPASLPSSSASAPAPRAPTGSN